MKKYTPKSLLELFLKQKRVCTDTRKIQAGDMYFALKGANFDGNAFAKQALEKGAAYAVIDDPHFFEEHDARFLLVENVLISLQEVARLYRQSLDTIIFGLTGSNGKTTTKELIASVLQTQKRIYATPGNYNNHIGVPLTLLGMPQDTEIAIIEMGTNQPGDIPELVEMAQPDYGLITNIGKAHLEKLGSQEGIRVEKGALFDYVKAHGKALFVNLADVRVAKTAQGAPRAITFGTAASDCFGKIVEMNLAGMKLEVKHRSWGQAHPFESKLSGEYNFINILAAISVGVAFGLPVEAIQQGIASYQSTNNRSQLIQQANRQIWLDAYNANPSSMKAAINYILSEKPKKVAVILGDMFELGEQSGEEHAAIGHLLNENPPDVLIGVGEGMQEAVRVFQGNGVSFLKTAEAKAQIVDLVKGAEVILIKGSRGMALEKLMEKLG